MAEQIQNNTAEVEESGSVFSVKDVWNIILLRWPWIILSTIIALCGAWFYLRYQVPTYSASAKILIKDESGSSKGSGSQLNMSEMGIISNTTGFENELQILSSTIISNAAVKALHLNVRYFAQGRLREFELYKCAPIEVSMSEEDMDNLNTSVLMKVTQKGSGIHLSSGIETEAANSLIKEQDLPHLPCTINTPVGKMHFEWASNRHVIEQDLKISIVPIKSLARSYASRLGASPSSKTTSVAILSMVDTEPQRAADYLTQLMESYNEDANNDKNEVATKTKEFITQRIEEIGSELSSTEGNLESYKKQNELINLSNDATNALSSSTSYQKEQVDMQTQLTLVKSLIDYVNNPANNSQIIPANIGISDALVNAQITQYNEALLQYNRLNKAGSDNNPTLAKLSEQLNVLHGAIGQSLRNILSNLQIQKRSIDSQYALFSHKIANTPTQERILTDIGRQQEIKAGLYLTLLQKREENLISLASTATKAKWLDEPQVGGQVSPKTQIIWLIAWGIGILLPIGIFFLLDLLRFRIEGRADVEKLSRLPLIADIPFAHSLKGKEERAIVVAENSNNTMEESFRGLRTNMRFIMGPTDKVILCTSTIPGEGKTFVCTNLAMSYALLGKKVLIVGLDIRKPQLVHLFHLPSDKRGITNYLADESADFNFLDEQIHHGIMNKNLDVMPAGIIPPNPGELISRHRLDEAIDHLKEHYDILLLDTPPVGLVSDTLELGRVANVTLFVCRADYSPKTNFSLINGLKDDNKLPNISLVLNGVDLKKRKYGYYYGYGKYGKYGYHKYGKYGHYGHYGHYGVYGNYTHDGNVQSGHNHIEK